MFIYKIEFPNGKVYIGQTNNLAARRRSHSYEVRKGNKRPLYNAMRKYLKEEPVLQVIDITDTQEELDRKEVDWISYFDSTNPDKGYNLSFGGNGNIWSSMSEYHIGCAKNRLRSKMVGRSGTMSLEAIAKRNKCSLEEARKLTPNYGKHRSDYVKKRASETHKNKIVSKEVREKQSNSQCKYEYYIHNTLTGEDFIVSNLYQWCKQENLPYGTMINRATDINENRKPKRRTRDWTIYRKLKKLLDTSAENDNNYKVDEEIIYDPE